MVYQNVRIEEVIGRVLRNTGIQDTSFITSFYEWIPEAMEMMQTKVAVSQQYTVLDIVFHKAPLPCGLLWIDAVETGGMRLAEGNSVRNIKTGHSLDKEPEINTYLSIPVRSEVAGQTYDTEFIPEPPTKTHPYHYYQIEPGYILTSFETGQVGLHYSSVPTDPKGFPLIPDESNYKEALYYFTRARMIGAGFLDPVFSEAELMARFEMYAARAIENIDYPSPNAMEHRVNTLTRFIPVMNYFENYYRVDEAERRYEP